MDDDDDAANFCSLPAELHAIVADFLEHLAIASGTGGALEPLKALRLVSKPLADAYSPLLFRRASLWPNTTDARRFQTLLRNPQLAPLIRGITFYTFVRDEDDDAAVDPSSTAPADEWLRAAEDVTSAPNLRAVEVCFRGRPPWGCDDSSAEAWVTGQQGNGLTVENVLESVCSKIAATSNTALDDLTLRCMPAAPLAPGTPTAIYLQQALSLLSSLALDLSFSQDRAHPLFTFAHKATHAFFLYSLPAYLSAASTLKTLSLSAGPDYWGFIPHSDWESLSFPSLRSFTLHRYTFAHPSILPFLARHAAHLTDLALHACPIISTALDPRLSLAAHARALPFAPDWTGFDAAGPRLLRWRSRVAPASGVARLWTHPWRWAQLFDTFRAALTALRRFDFDDGGGNADAEAHLARSAYVAFVAGVGRVVWAGAEADGRVEGLEMVRFSAEASGAAGAGAGVAGSADEIVLRAPVDIACDGEALRKLRSVCRERQAALDCL